MAHNYDVGTRAWQPDSTEGWVASEVESKNVQGDKVKLVFQLANGEASRWQSPLEGSNTDITVDQNSGDYDSCITR